ncbi:MAG: hypothetical protein QUU85_20055 [Candidatus Eisenbacteria bacterium]|nr:hypothetical protein [Candidatus Eisenbacteria bacterium]
MDRVGFLRGLAGTVSLSLRNPEEFFRAIARGNAMLPALVFGILMAVFTGIIDSFYDFVALRLFGPAMQSVQSDLPEIFRGDLATSFRENLYIRGVFILLYPALTFVASGVVHMFLRVFSGPAGVRRDFASTFRVTNYVSAVGALVLLPFCGRLIAGIWEIVLAVRGYARVQGTSHFASIGAIVLTGLLFACLWALAASISGGLGVLRSMGSGGA